MPEKIVTIYLRSVVKDKRDCLAMFDSNRKGDINNLETVVHPGDKLVWALDSEHGIKELVSIRSKEVEPKLILKPLTAKSGGFQIMVPDSPIRSLEAYIIEYIIEVKDREKGEKGEKVVMVDKTVVIDPYIRIKPPSDTDDI